MNITDVGHLTSDADTGEDKLETSSKKEKKSVWDIANFYTKEFKKDIAKLNIIPPDIWCKATDHIKEMIDLVKRLEDKGYTYKIEDGIYFDTSKFKNYGKFARLKIEDLKSGARIEQVPGKKNPTDFSLWKFSPKNKKRQMEWPSPFGLGFPGWHIECTAMSMKYLGDHFDIHTGGIDHIPIHHTNEIAQAESVTGKKWVNYWLHGEFLVLEKEKMAKSGSFIRLQTLIDKSYDPLDYRYLCLNTHYRKQLKFTWESLDNAKKSFSKLKDTILEIKSGKTNKLPKKYLDEFLKIINDDLNMPKALALLWKVLRDSSLSNNEKYSLTLEFDKVLGLNLGKIKKEKLNDEIQNLINKRELVRKEKNFKKADEIRSNLKKKGIILEDTKQGVKWKKI